jgi:cation diffusion facilitator CzcD-associated flavoprotein CzcO
MSLKEAKREPLVESSIYANLHTNLPLRLMALYNRPYPSSLPDYPPFPEVLKYWQAYADDYQLHQYISLNTRVILVERTVNNKAWRVVLEKSDNDSAKPLQWEEEFDAVVMSNGHHRMPYTPYIPGLALLSEKWPERVLHSAEYRHPEVYKQLVSDS